MRQPMRMSCSCERGAGLDGKPCVRQGPLDQVAKPTQALTQRRRGTKAETGFNLKEDSYLPATSAKLVFWPRSLKPFSFLTIICRFDGQISPCLWVGDYPRSRKRTADGQNTRL